MTSCCRVVSKALSPSRASIQQIMCRQQTPRRTFGRVIGSARDRTATTTTMPAGWSAGGARSASQDRKVGTKYQPKPPTPKRDGSLGDARVLFTLLTCALNADDAMSHSTGHPGQQQHHHHHGGGRGRGRGRGGGGRGRGGNRNVRQVLTEKFARARGHCWRGWPSQWCPLERRRRLHHVLPRCTAVRSRAPTAVY